MGIRAWLATASFLAVAACGGDERPAAEPASGPAGRPDETVLAAWTETAGSTLFWADGRTLEPVDGRSVSFSYYLSAVDRSPDGGTLALGADDRGYVQLVDLERMRSLGTIDLHLSGFLERLHWVAPDLLLASISGNPSLAAALDPSTRQVLVAEELEGAVLASRPVEYGIVMLLAPSDRIGPARLAVFDGSRVRSVELAEVRAGWEEEGDTGEDYRARQSVPGLAVEPGGRRALVVPAGNRVAEVDLATLAVRYHDLSEPVSLLGRLRRWLEPPAHAKLIEGPERNAVWLPSGLVAVSGSRYTTDGDDVDVAPAGLALVDPADWSVRRLGDEASWVTFRGGALLAFAWREESAEQAVTVFGPGGEHRFGLSRESSDLSQVSGGHLYAASEDGTRYELVDLATGATVGRASPERPTWLVQIDD